MKPFVIGIAGGSASGTTLAQALAHLVRTEAP